MKPSIPNTHNKEMFKVNNNNQLKIEELRNETTQLKLSSINP